MNQRSAMPIAVEEGPNSTMSRSLTEDYLRWLAPQIRDSHDGVDILNDCWEILIIMFEKPFVDLVAYDDNRMADGLDLRSEFRREFNIPIQAEGFPIGPCSFLEVLIGLSRRLAFNAGGSAPAWAWALIENLDLDRMVDPLSRYKIRKAHSIIDRCIQREYHLDGHGGFFPLVSPSEDQRQVELWYQMAAYINEQRVR